MKARRPSTSSSTFSLSCSSRSSVSVCASAAERGSAAWMPTVPRTATTAAVAMRATVDFKSMERTIILPDARTRASTCVPDKSLTDRETELRHAGRGDHSSPRPGHRWSPLRDQSARRAGGYGRCTMMKNDCSNGSPMAAAVARIRSKHSSMSCGTSSGWKTDCSMPTAMWRSRPAAASSANRLLARMAWRLRMVLVVEDPGQVDRQPAGDLPRRRTAGRAPRAVLAARQRPPLCNGGESWPTPRRARRRPRRARRSD